MKHARVLKAWKRILTGHYPVLAVELTSKCPLSCPGCYAFQPNHVNGKPLSSLIEYRGEALVSHLLDLLDDRQPLGVFIVGGEPLLRVRELDAILPEISRRGIEVEIVTSAIVPIPRSWRRIPGLCISVSIDGLQPDHDRRRSPATYTRILENIQGHQVIVHCTVTGQMMEREDSLLHFLEFWDSRPEVKTIRISLYTPQKDEVSTELLSPQLREKAISDLESLCTRFDRLRLSPDMLRAYRSPPSSPEKCIFAQVTECLATDFQTPVGPCQLGGNPDCRQCGCVAAIGVHAIGLTRLAIGLELRQIFTLSSWTGGLAKKARATSRLPHQSQ